MAKVRPLRYLRFVPPIARKLALSDKPVDTHSATLQNNKGRIIDLWEKRLRQDSSAFLGQDSPALHNSIGIFLDEMIEALSEGKSRSQLQQEVSKAHGRIRAKLQGYSLAQVLTEFQTLRKIVVDVLEEEAGPLSRTQLDIIFSSIEGGLLAAGSEFMLVSLEAKERRIQESQSNLAASRTLVHKLREERNLRELFVATLTHDLRNPLTAVKTSADLLHRKGDDPKLVEKLSGRISTDIARIGSMIDSLLDANRIKAGEKLSFEVSPLDLNAQVTALVEELLTAYGDRFFLQAPKEPITGYWNWGRLRRVIENLVTNALKYGDSNTPVTLSLSQSENEVRISVHNWGDPIRPEDQVTLFEQYRRTQSAKTGGKKGWGLGLTLVRGITEAHGGHVKVESAQDKGTTFTVVLPKDSRPYSS